MSPFYTNVKLFDEWNALCNHGHLKGTTKKRHLLIDRSTDIPGIECSMH